ncbi:hypothetical protein SEA_MUFASA8_11 [Arthrobacter phage Mufasa8]|uniref:Uncharacterized protein n=1 Tax=Arthrobacter phage Mufasa8 TaxID=2656526 RepID=A0A649VMJ9_9CAUD|nr:hypothetical protein HYQ08_gp011 [Arthrobacter phage Mufasa8]QGJ93461.1 hypothetical protein SEA_MUFASA8_11 [Arthrobacter phage Mufasa8]
MHSYIYTGTEPRVLTGLIHCTNAWHSPASGNPSELIDGQTVEVEPGDTVRTEDPYLHPLLDEVTEVPDLETKEPAERPVRVRKPRKGQSPTPDPESPADPTPAGAGDETNGDAD